MNKLLSPTTTLCLMESIWLRAMNNKFDVKTLRIIKACAMEMEFEHLVSDINKMLEIASVKVNQAEMEVFGSLYQNPNIESAAL